MRAKDSTRVAVGALGQGRHDNLLDPLTRLVDFGHGGEGTLHNLARARVGGTHVRFASIVDILFHRCCQLYPEISSQWRSAAQCHRP